MHCEVSCFDMKYITGLWGIIEHHFDISEDEGYTAPSAEEQIRAASAEGLDWLIFTDHDEMFNPDLWNSDLNILLQATAKLALTNSQKLWKRNADKYNDWNKPEQGDSPQVIVGEEMGSVVPGVSLGHFLTYFSGKKEQHEPIYWESTDNTKDMLKKVRDANGFGFMAHPVGGPFEILNMKTWNFFPFIDGDHRPIDVANITDPYQLLKVLISAVEISLKPWEIIDDPECGGQIAGFEILNHPHHPQNETLLRKYDELLKKGRKLRLIGGGDAHIPEDVGRTQTWVRVHRGRRSDEEILGALRNGRAVVAERGGPVVVFNASAGGMTREIGDDLLVNNGDAVQLDISRLQEDKRGEKRPEPKELKVVKSWEEQPEIHTGCPDSLTVTVPSDFESKCGGIGSIRLECSADDGGTRFCYTNPIFLRAKSGPGAATSTAMVFDVSGSMSEITADNDVKIDAAKESAKLLLRMIGQNRKSGRPAGSDQVALVTFSDYSSLELGLTDNLTTASEAVNDLYPQDSTNLGAGIEEGIGALSAPAASGTQKYMIVLSDGMSNTGMSNTEILIGPVSIAGSSGIKIFTVGFGDASNLDEDLLGQIAQTTGGEYLTAASAYRLNQLYADIRLSAVGPSIGTFDGSVSQGQTAVLGGINVPPGTQELHGMLIWPGSKLDFELKDPSGRAVDQSYPGANLSTDDTPVYYIIANPIPGSWSVAVSGVEVPGAATDFHASFSARPSPPVLPVDWAALSSGIMDVEALKNAFTELVDEARKATPISKKQEGAAWIYLAIGMVLLAGAVALGVYQLKVRPAPAGGTATGLCPTCGKKTGIGWVRCAHCGTAIVGGYPGGALQRIAPSAVPAEEPGGQRMSLTIEEGPGVGGTYMITGTSTRIGRGRGNDIVVDDPEVSSNHARISLVQRKFVLEDLGSSNGTLVNGERISACRLRDGDIVGIGGTALRVSL